MLDASSAIMTRTGMFRTNEISVAVTRSAFGNEEYAQNRPNASVAPTGAENTALKIAASTAEASRTSPVLRRTNSPPRAPGDVALTASLTLSSASRLDERAASPDSRTQTNTRRQPLLRVEQADHVQSCDRCRP